MSSFSYFLSPSFIRLSTEICVGTYGLKEIVLDGKKPAQGPVVAGSLTTRIKLYCQEYFSRKWHEISTGQFHIIHGALFLGSGIAGTVAALHQLGKIHLSGSAFAIFNHLEMGLFLSGCFGALYYNIREYQRVTDPASKLSAVQMQQQTLSTIVGIISSIDYILWGALTIIGAPAAIALVFGLIGLSTGCFKILYDYYHPLN